MKKITMICMASALAFQSSIAFAELSKNEQRAVDAGLAMGALANANYAGNLVSSKMTGPVPNEKPLSAYGKDVTGRSSNVDDVHQKRMQIVMGPAKRQGVPGTIEIYGEKVGAAIALNTETGNVRLVRPLGSTLLKPENRWMWERKVVDAAFYDNEKYVVTLDNKNALRKYSVYDGKEVKIYGNHELEKIRALLESQRRAKTIDLKAPVFEADIRRLTSDYTVAGHDDIRVVEIGKRAYVKKALANFSKRMGVKGYAKLGGSAALQTAMMGGYLYTGDDKIEKLSEVKNAPQARPLEQDEAAQGEK